MASSGVKPLVFQLNEAIAQGDVSTMTWILEKMQGDHVNEGDNNDNTPLHKACGRLNNPVAVAALLGTPGIDVNKRNFLDYSPIMFSAGRCNRESLVLLLDDYRVDLEACTSDGRGLEDVVGIDKGTREQREQVLKLIQDEKTRRKILEEKQEYFKDGQKEHAVGFSRNINDKEHLIKENNPLNNQECSTPTKKELEQVRDTVKNQYKSKIEEFNRKIEEKEKNMQEKQTEKEYMKQNHILEKKVVVEKLRQEMKELELRMRKEIDETDAKHREDMMKLEKCQQIEQDQKTITIMKVTVEKLTKDLNNFDFGAGNKNADVEAAREDLECPVCLETMKPPTRIWMCSSTHLICQSCKLSLDDKICPTCRSEEITIRAYFAENMARNLFFN